MRRDSLTLRVALFFGTLLLLVVVLEFGVRIAAPEPLVDTAGTQLRRGAFTRPGDHPVATDEFRATVHVNGDGFVDEEWSDKAPGERRVVLIGDSFVQAAQVDLEEGVGRVLEDELEQLLAEAARDDPPPVEVLSMGVPGAGTGTALMLLEAEALPRDPELVVLGFLVSNDVLNNHPLLDSKPDKPYFRLSGDKLVRWAPQDASAEDRSVQDAVTSSVLWRHSHLLRAVGRTAWRSAEARSRLARGRGVPLELRVHDPAMGPRWQDAWAVTDALVQEMARRCEAAGVDFGVLLFPDRVQATADGLADARRRWPPLRDWDVHLATERARRHFAEYAPVLDLTPALRAADDRDESPLYFPRDGHWTPRGHQVAAQAAAPVLARWLDPGGDSSSDR